MKLKDFIVQNFNINLIPNEEGIYSVLFKEENREISIETDSDQYTQNKTGSIVMIECDDDNFMALKTKIGKKEVFVIDGTKINGADFFNDEYEDIEGEMVKEHAIILYSDSWIKRYLRIDFYPELKVSLEIDYDKYDTDEDGIIIWE